MSRRVVSIETFIVTVPRDTPYLGPLAAGEFVNTRGYVVRRGNGTLYPTQDRSIVVRVATATDPLGGHNAANVVNRLAREGDGVQIEQSPRARAEHGAAIADAVAGVYLEAMGAAGVAARP